MNLQQLPLISTCSTDIWNKFMIFKLMIFNSEWKNLHDNGLRNVVVRARASI